MDADKMLDEVRRAVERVYVAPEPQSAEGQRVMRHLVAVADYFRALDSYLSQGGKPPTAWSEGPDVPDEHIYVGIRPGTFPIEPIDHPVPFDRPPVEPLGGPVPGVDGSHLPEHPDQGCVRCGNPIAWYGDTWAHKSPGHGDHPATAGLWPGAAIANDEPGR